MRTGVAIQTSNYDWDNVVIYENTLVVASLLSDFNVDFCAVTTPPRVAKAKCVRAQVHKWPPPEDRRLRRVCAAGVCQLSLQFLMTKRTASSSVLTSRSAAS